MNQIEILKQIDSFLNETESLSGLCFDKESYFELLENYYHNTQKVMQNFDKILEQEHFKKQEL